MRKTKKERMAANVLKTEELGRQDAAKRAEVAFDFDDEDLVLAPAADRAVTGDGSADAAEPLPPGPVEVVIEDGAAAERLDAALARRLAALSRSRIKALIAEGHVTLEGAPVADPSRRVGGGARIVIDVPPPAVAAPEPEAIPLDVVYEDDDVIVIDKQPGLVVHPSPGNWSGTLVNALLAHCGASLSGIGGVMRPGIVHRLDKDTSGLMVVAKTDRAHQSLAAQFADHGRTGPLERAYLAIVWGNPREREGTLESLIGRSPKNRELMAVVQSGGKEAITHYQVLESFGGDPRAGRKARDDDGAVASLVECVLETGRTHQIRVHMTAMGHPLLGDPDYGAHFKTKAAKLAKTAPDAAEALEALARQALHARLLAFEHPKTRKTMRFESDPPADMERLIEALRSL